jgi:hypothetical protein
MRTLSLLLASLTFLIAQPANALVLTNGEEAIITGPFDPTTTLVVSATITVNGNFNVESYPISTYVAVFQAFATVSPGPQLYTCAQNFGGNCGNEGPPPQGIFFITAPTTITMTTSFAAQVFDDQTNQPVELSGITETVSVDLELLRTSDFTIAAVPEPSTWAMMLVGFAAVGFAGWRVRQPRSPANQCRANTCFDLCVGGQIGWRCRLRRIDDLILERVEPSRSGIWH